MVLYPRILVSLLSPGPIAGYSSFRNPFLCSVLCSRSCESESGDWLPLNQRPARLQWHVSNWLNLLRCRCSSLRITEIFLPHVLINFRLARYSLLFHLQPSLALNCSGRREAESRANVAERTSAKFYKIAPTDETRTSRQRQPHTQPQSTRIHQSVYRNERVRQS